jgi:hypothetical protein
MKTKRDVIAFFCRLANAVQDEAFNNLGPADCFCGLNSWADDCGDFLFSDDVLRFIQQAVSDKLGKPLEIVVYVEGTVKIKTKPKKVIPAAAAAPQSASYTDAVGTDGCKATVEVKRP